jgi:hypothetical protein
VFDQIAILVAVVLKRTIPPARHSASGVGARISPDPTCVLVAAFDSGATARPAGVSGPARLACTWIVGLPTARTTRRCALTASLALITMRSARRIFIGGIILDARRSSAAGCCECDHRRQPDERVPAATRAPSFPVARRPDVFIDMTQRHVRLTSPGRHGAQQQCMQIPAGPGSNSGGAMQIG